MSPFSRINKINFSLLGTIKIGTIVFLTLFLHFQLAAQKYRYDVVKGGKSIGEMIAVKTVNGDTTEYKIDSKTVYKMIFNLKINYFLYETYVKGALLKGNGESTLNGSIQRKVETRRLGDIYEVENTSNIIKIDQNFIRYSIPELYFSEPKGSTKIFSQIFASYLEFEKIGEHKFMLYSDDGKNTYFYKDGICVEVEVNRPYATFSMILKPR